MKPHTINKCAFWILLSVALGLLIALVWVTHAKAGQVTLQWDSNNPTPENYRVFQRVEGGIYNYSKPVWPTDGKDHAETTCTIKGLAEGVTYYFVVRAHVGNKESGDSNEVDFRCCPPPTPINVQLKKEGEKMYLISDPQPGDTVDYYEVEISGNIVRSDAERAGNEARLHHDLAGITMGDHTARVRAVNGWGNGDWSDPFGFGAQLPGAVSGIGLSAD